MQEEQLIAKLSDYAARYVRQIEGVTLKHTLCKLRGVIDSVRDTIPNSANRPRSLLIVCVR
jgi:tRNA U34 5-methylaminomethyl-2-thiouridine-forming methyltransferase MnmC